MLAEYLEPKKILIDFNEHSYRVALQKMIGLSAEKNVDDILDSILNRDKVMPTAMGKGIFLPRAIIDDKPKSEVIMAINHGGITLEDYGTSVANIIMVFLFSKNDDHAAILAQSLRLLTDDSLRAALFDCRNPDEVIKAITDWENQ
jgi:mannitol/fructose-specific phosphotransferase system IIA component (Ntr-type)